MMKAVIVDDEPKAITSMSMLIENYCKNVQVVGTATSAFEAVSIILKEKPDVVFLDINMPGHNGFDVLEQVQSTQVKIIFTTAHKEYAINAIRKGAFDYILKPVDPDDLQKCIQRLENDIKPSAISSTIQINVKEGVLFIQAPNIVKLKANGSYTDFYLDDNKKLTTSKVMKEYEMMLDPQQFYRCHNSYIINLTKVEKLLNENGYFVVFKDGSRAEVSRKNKEELLDRIKILHAKS